MNYASAPPLHDPEELPSKRSQLVWRAYLACVAGVFIGCLCDKDGYPIGGWQHRMSYVRQGHTYLLTSCGADGKPGGTGLNADLTNLNPRPPQAQPSIVQILALPASRPIEKGALVCALLTACLTLFSIKATDLTKAGRKALVLKLGLLLIAAYCLSIVVAATDLPNPH